MSALEPDDVREIRRRLLDHYDEARRELPWRGEEDPYRVWVSEVMLQQTRVETVVPYYKRWMERFPTLEALADAERDDILQLWKGLGYYSRARNLHRAAGVVRERFDGELPGTVEGLKELPGVGPYTAGAIASIAFDVPTPAVDGNVRRVLSRLFDLPDPTDAELRERAAELVDPERPGDLNQAVMELGATICAPSSPACGRCPVADLCVARARGTVAERPPSKSRGPVPRREVVSGVTLDPAGRTLVTRRPEDGLLGGMWEFPGTEPDDGERAVETARRAVTDRLAGDGGRVAFRKGERAVELTPVEHAFTHLRITYRAVLLEVEELAAPGDEVRLLPLDDLDAVPLPVAQQKIGLRARRARPSLAEAGGHPPE